MTTAPPVLVIDDDLDIRETIETVLRHRGWPVATAENGAAALDWLHGHPAPCMILLDLMMPMMDGFEFRERQLAEPALAEIPTVIMTGAGTLKREIDVLIKPVSVKTLIGYLEKHCRRERE